WRACSWLRRLRVSFRDVIVIDFDPSSSPRPQCSESVVDQTAEVLLERLRRSHPWRPARHDRAVSLWDKYVDTDLERFARTCTRGVEGFPELAAVWWMLSSFFPRKRRAGALHLSRFDQIVLDILSGEWQTPAAMFT